MVTSIQNYISGVHTLHVLLCSSDILAGKKGLVVQFQWSKTNQFSSRVLLAMPYSPLCPLEAYKKHMNYESHAGRWIGLGVLPSATRPVRLIRDKWILPHGKVRGC